MDRGPRGRLGNTETSGNRRKPVDPVEGAETNWNGPLGSRTPIRGESHPVGLEKRERAHEIPDHLMGRDSIDAPGPLVTHALDLVVLDPHISAIPVDLVL